jgi:alpha-1,3-mannosyltransferase
MVVAPIKPVLILYFSLMMTSPPHSWVIRDSCGLPTKEIWPYFPSDRIAIDNLRRDSPIEVATCWNGAAIFDARWFLPRNDNTQGQPQYLCRIFHLKSSNIPFYLPVPTIPHTGQLTPNLPLRFRDNPACVASECFLISYDMHLLTAPERPRIYVNPQVNVGKHARCFVCFILFKTPSFTSYAHLKQLIPL